MNEFLKQVRIELDTSYDRPKIRATKMPYLKCFVDTKMTQFDRQIVYKVGLSYTECGYSEYP